MIQEIVGKYEGEYKANLLGKKSKIYLYIHEQLISGLGAYDYDGKFKLTENYVEIEFQNMADIGERLIQGNRCLFITYRELDSLIKNAVNTIYFPNIKNMEQAITVLCEMQKKCLACREKE